MRKPFVLLSTAISLILCSWMLDATVLDVGTGLITRDSLNGTGPQDVYASNASNYEIYRNMSLNQSLPWKDRSIAQHLAADEAMIGRDHEAISREPDTKTLILLSTGIIGVVGFWRRVMH